MRFLGEEWLDRMTSTLSSESPATSVTVHQRVTGGPDGDVEYTLHLSDDGVTFERGSGPADVTLTADYATAVAISQGRLSPSAAFAGGQLHVVGSVSALAGQAEELARLGTLLGGMAEDTTY